MCEGARLSAQSSSVASREPAPRVHDRADAAPYDRPMLRSNTPAALALRAALIAGSFMALLQLSGAVKPIQLLSAARIGQGSALVLNDFGPEHLRSEDPFDGQYIYVTARLLPDLDSIASQIYESDYRLVRILHPLLASPGGQGTPVIVLLELWNLLGLALFAGSLASLLSRYGQDTGAVVASTLVACAIPFLLTTSEPLAFGLGMAGLALADRHRLIAAIPLLALAGLTRESALTFAAAAAVLIWTRRRKGPAAFVLMASAAPTALWWVYVQTITAPSRVPLAPLGILQLGAQTWSNILISLVVLSCIGISVVAWTDVPPLRWLALGFAAWIPLYESFAFKVVGLPRLSLPSIALAVAGIVRWQTRQQSAAESGDGGDPGPRSAPRSSRG